jgi:Flp pilus assembly protein TadG
MNVTQPAQTGNRQPGQRVRNNRANEPRRGNIIVFSAFLMVFMMFMIAMSVDVGYIYTMQAQLDRAVDAAALAGVQDLVNGTDAAQAKATEYLVRNPVGSSMTFVDETQIAAQTAAFQSAHSDDFDFKSGNWDPTTRTFSETSVSPSSLQVTMTYPNLPFFFGRVMGKDSFTLTSSATAMFQPRDIVVVLDFSASMNDDSEFGAIGKLPRATVESSLQNCWNDLGPPSYGLLGFTPQWATAQGVPQNSGNGTPHISVEYRNTAAYVASTHSLVKVKLTFSGGSTQTFSTFTPSGTKTGTFSGTGGNAGKRVTKVQVRSWNNNNAFGTDGESFDFAVNSTFKNALGLNSVAYPYSSGSWDGYIDYCESSSNSNADAGYRYKFGGMSLVSYWFENYPSYSKIPDLWKTRHEPLYALKDSMAVFMDFISSVDTQDRVALVIYDATDGNAILESNFTEDLTSISNIVNHRQAGHYHDYTNIGAGMQKGRETLVANARPNASKLMVLMTDGLANWHNGNYDLDGAADHVASEAAAAVAAKFKIMTVCVGAGGDTSTMQSVADTTDGTFYHIPGGASHQTMHDQLKQAFKEIANARPMLLVK